MNTGTSTINKILLLTLILIFGQNFLLAQDNWKFESTKNMCTPRHENAFVKAGDKFYILGGRGIKPVEKFDPRTLTWSKGNQTPFELSHFQAVSHNGLIYIMGAFTGNWPYETPTTNIFIYNPVEDSWIIGPKIPSHRQRGAAGTVVHNDKIYLIGGLVNGHTSGWVPWFDEFDPTTNSWKELPDAPHSRDHFQSAVVNNKLIVAGGRKSGYNGKGFEETIAKTDIYDFNTGNWKTLPSPSGDIPTERAGCTMVAIGDEIIVLGGESGAQKQAHNEVEALNVETGTWRKLSGLQTGRHGTQALISKNSIYIAAGCGNRGGSPELNSLESYEFTGLNELADESIIPGQLKVSANEYAFEKIKSNEPRSASFQLTNSDGNQSIVIPYMILTGSNDFQLDFPYTFPYILGPNRSVSFNVRFTSKNNLPVKASLLIKEGISKNEKPLEVSIMSN